MNMPPIRPQSDWEEPHKKINGPAPKGTPGKWIIHYPGSPNGYEPMTDDEMIQHLRASQSSYLANRGYSYGYSVVVSQSGSAWAVRGLEGVPGVRVYNPASNPGRKLRQGSQNNVTRSIQIAVGKQNKATPEAVATVNAIIATQPDWPVFWHGQIDYTACAGDGLIQQIKSGEIGHQATPPSEGDDEMKMVNQYRAVDTRIWPGSKVPTEETMRMSTGENVPVDAAWIIATLTVTQPEAGGHVSTAKPGSLIGKTSSINFAAGQTVANTTFIPVKNRQFDLRVRGGATHVVVDVLGYVI